MHERVVQQGHHGHAEVVGQRRDVADTPRVLVLHLRGAAGSVLPRAGRGDGAIEVIGRGKGERFPPLAAGRSRLAVSDEGAAVGFRAGQRCRPREQAAVSSGKRRFRALGAQPAHPQADRQGTPLARVGRRHGRRPFHREHRGEAPEPGRADGRRRQAGSDEGQFVTRRIVTRAEGRGDEDKLSRNLEQKVTQ